MIEEKLVERFIAADARGIKYVALDLITRDYNVSLLVRLAKENGIGQRMGYVADVVADAAEKQGLVQSSKLKLLADSLFDNYKSWRFLNKGLPEYAKNLIIDRSISGLNYKWKIYSSLTTGELEDWIDLYITEEYVTKPREQRIRRG